MDTSLLVRAARCGLLASLVLAFAAHAQGFDRLPQQAPPPLISEVRVGLVQATALPAPFHVAVDVALPAAPPEAVRARGGHAYADSARSPLDTLRMSPWERLWWGRGGVMRLTGLFPTHPDVPMNDLRQVAQVRRKMLRWHQTLGLVTVASMATTVVGGQLAASGRGASFHKTTLPLTIGLYSTTAALALLSPPKPIRLGRGGIDSITIHRWLAVGHLAGMFITPMLGEDGAGRVHYAMGYATFATFSAAMLTVTLLRH